MKPYKFDDTYPVTNASFLQQFQRAFDFSGILVGVAM